MRPAEAMSRLLSCVLTSRRTLGTQCPRSGSLTPGDDVTWPALVDGAAVSIGDFGCQTCGDMSMSGGGIQRCPSTIGDVTTVRPVGGHRRAGAGLGPAPGSAGRRAPVVPAAAAPDQGYPGGDAPGWAGWWRTGLPNSAQQDADLDPTARAARWHGLVGQVVVGCPVGLPNRVVTCDNTPGLVPPRRPPRAGWSVGQLVGCACADGRPGRPRPGGVKVPSPFLESPDVPIEVPVEVKRVVVCRVAPAVAGLAFGRRGAGVRPADLRTRPAHVLRPGAAGAAAADPARRRTP